MDWWVLLLLLPIFLAAWGIFLPFLYLLVVYIISVAKYQLLKNRK